MLKYSNGNKYKCSFKKNKIKLLVIISKQLAKLKYSKYNVRKSSAKHSTETQPSSILRSIMPSSRRNNHRNSGIQSDETNKNSKMGILIPDEDIKAAFDFFDVKGSGKITGSNLKERFEALTKKITKKEIKTILDGKDFITIQEIKEILKNNELEIDPYEEAFSILDPTGKGFISEERLRKMFYNLGYGDLSEEELQLLITTGDADKDGRIGLSDFTLLGTSSNLLTKSLEGQKKVLISQMDGKNSADS